jgi:hypothetical protein
MQDETMVTGKTRRMTAWLRRNVGTVLAGVAMLLAVVALVISLTHSGPTGATGAQGAMGPPGEAADVTALQVKVDTLTAYKQQVEACLPEFVDYVNSGSVETSTNSNGNATWVTDAYLTWTTQVDRNCRRFLGFTGTGD